MIQGQWTPQLYLYWLRNRELTLRVAGAYSLLGCAAGDGLFMAEKRDGSGRYPLRVRMRYFFFWFSPASFTAMARQPRLGFGRG